MVLAVVAADNMVWVVAEAEAKAAVPGKVVRAAEVRGRMGEADN